ncbi:MAG: ParB N-terminal domain-containing protein [Phycisphaerae bacterium]|nr:ParB N-terminal domain-containing protein [Phycisphaerae bacterium]
MADLTAQIVPMSDRRFRMIPLAEITVLNPRNRDKQQFEDNIRSIDSVGLLKPILVNDRHRADGGKYELVCGEGRFLAYKSLGRTEIPAEVVDCDRKTALLYSLVENIARVPPNTMWFAREMKRMCDAGLPLSKISQIVGKPEHEVADYIRLVEMGEERLITGVEQGMFSISFAIAVAKSSSDTIQQVLMDAFDSGIIDSANTNRVRNMIELRLNRGKQPRRGPLPKPTYTLQDLKRDIAEATMKREGFVRESQSKENRLLTLLEGLNMLWKDERLVALLGQHGMAERPVLTGKYTT